MKHFLLLVLLFLGSALMPSGKLFAHIEKIYFLNGKVGERELAIKMLVYDESPDRYITYFFQDNKKDEQLVGKYRDKFWVFRSGDAWENGAAKAGVRLTIAEDGAEGKWKGTWTDSTGRSWDVSLKPLVPEAIPAKFNHLQYVQELDPYEHFKLSSISFEKVKTDKHTKELVCDWYLEKESGITFFRLRSLKNKINVEQLNTSLETLHLSMVQNYFKFSPEKTDTKVETSLLYLSDELLSFRVLWKHVFNTGRAAQSRVLYTYDVAEGQQVDLESLVWIDNGVQKPDPQDLEQVFKYRKDVFAPALLKMLTELYPDKMDNARCELNKPATWIFPAWNLTGKGIAFGSFTVDACDVLPWAVVPYKKLKPFMQQKYHLKPKK